MATVSAEVTPEVRTIHRLTAAFIAVAIVALAIANVPALFQAFDRAGINLYPYARPVIRTYYQGLTIHGVMNVLVWTIFFLSGFFSFVTVYALGRPLASMRLGWAAFWIMLAGLVMALIPIFANTATVLYTFYPPLKASPLFYIGLTLIVVGTWLIGWNILQTWRGWRRDNPGERTPLAVFGTLATYALWTIASVGLAIEMLVFLIPWSLGVTETIDPLLSRTLFWFTGHPIVYFWLLPAYAIIYTVLPKQAGGKLVSDPMARLAFLLFLLLSTPVGFHHQFADPGIDPTWKMIHSILTFFVAVPSLMTAFTIAASLEFAGRLRGGKGLFGWIRALPWDNPAFVAPVLGLLGFIPGGAGGIVNASFTLDYVVHNTAWIPGHFHLQVASLVTLTAMGSLYWLLPNLTGKPISDGQRRLGLAVVWLWFIGMMVMALGLHWAGLLNVPRRSYIAQVPDAYPQAAVPMVFNVLAGIILLVALLLFIYGLFSVLLSRERKPELAEAPVPFAEVLSGPEDRRLVQAMDRIGFWFAVAAILVVLAYGPTLVQLFSHLNPVPGWRLW